jgi:ABC-2 type transport system permease protein
MPPLLRALPTVARVSVARHVAYRAEMTIWILTATLPLIMLGLWNAVAADGPVAGFDQADVARYFVATLICRQLTGAWVIWELSYAIRLGQLSPQLLRPFPPLLNYAVWMVTAMPFRLAILTPVVLALIAWRPDLFELPPPSLLLLFLPSIALAWTMNFLIQCAFGLLAFWLDKTDGIFGVWQSVWFLLSGYVAPLAFFPVGWQRVLAWSPFRGMLAAPVEALGGFVDPAQARFDLAVQAGWTVACFLLVAVLWKRGVARYGAFGA